MVNEQAVLEQIFSLAGYAPGPEQRAVHLALLQPRQGPEGPLPRTVILAGGEQGGKSWTAAHHVFGDAALTPTGQKRLYWLVGNRYEDARREYEYLRDAALRVELTQRGLYSAAETGPWRLRMTNGATIKVLSSDDPTVLAREAPDGIVMCEPGRQSYEAFQYLWRRAVPKNAWLLVAGTFEGPHSRWLADLWRQCQGDNPWGGISLSLPSYANRELYPLGAKDPKFLAALKAIRDANPTEAEEEIGERFLGIPRQPKGLVFSEFRRALHVKEYAEFDPNYPVALAVDPGYYPSAYAVLWIQVIGGQVRVFDEFYFHHLVSSEVLTEVENHYAFGNLAHVVIDVAAKAHAGAQGSAYETWSARLAERNITIAGSRVGINERNARIHDKLRVSPLSGQSYLVLHPRVKFLAWELEEGYRLRERTGGAIGSDAPVDKDNHSVAAIGYFIWDRYGASDVRARPHPPTVRKSVIDVAFGRRG